MDNTGACRHTSAVIVSTVMTAGGDIHELLADLERRREARAGTENEITQGRIADLLDVDRSYVSLLLRGKRGLRNLTGEQVFHLLRVHGYNTSLIKVAVEKYRLNYPPQLLPEDGSTPPPGMVSVMYEGSITDREEPRRMNIYDPSEGRFDPDDLRLRISKSTDLTTATSRHEVPVGTQILLHTSMEPDRGKGAIIRQGDVEAYCTWPLAGPEHMVPIDPASGADPVLFRPDDVEFVARVVFVTISHI